jgi:hypothetical protein
MKECQYCGKDITNNYMELYCNIDHFKEYWKFIRGEK